FQAEDGIRDGHVTGVQTCALPIYVAEGDALLQLEAEPGGIDPPPEPRGELVEQPARARVDSRAVAERAEGMEGGLAHLGVPGAQIGRASCRERGRTPEQARRARST